MATKSVVILEDDEDIAEVIRLTLTAVGLKVQVANDGERGLELVRKSQPDAVLLDIMMPKMNGYEVCAALQSDPATKNLPILVITGITDSASPEEDRQWRSRLSVSDFISKPLDTKDLTQRVLSILGE